MLKMKDFQDFMQGVMHKSYADLSMVDLQMHLTPKLQEYDLPVKFETDEVKSGGLFSTSSLPCLVIINSEHKSNYYYIVIVLSKQGAVGVLNFYLTGYSKNATKLEFSEGMAKNRIRIPVNQHKIQDEQNYYNILKHALSESFC